MVYPRGTINHGDVINMVTDINDIVNINKSPEWIFDTHVICVLQVRPQFL